MEHLENEEAVPETKREITFYGT